MFVYLGLKAFLLISLVYCDLRLQEKLFIHVDYLYCGRRRKPSMNPGGLSSCPEDTRNVFVVIKVQVLVCFLEGYGFLYIG